jgi:hypothetical protein
MKPAEIGSKVEKRLTESGIIRRFSAALRDWKSEYGEA